MDWKQLLKLNQDEVFGLDIGSSTVRIIQLRKDNSDYVVIAAGIVDIAEATEGDTNRKEINTAKAIRDCLESVGVHTQFAVCGVSRPDVAVRYFKFPSLPPEEIQGAVLLEAEQVCPFNVGDYAVDYQLTSSSENEVSGILVAATNKQIKRKIRLAENASLGCVLMDVDGLAVMNCFRESEKPEAGRTIGILNVDSSCTHLTIVGDNNWPFIREITYAGNDIVEQIAMENDISVKTARKSLFGYENSSQSQLELDDSLAMACEKLITNVIETLRYYTAQEKSDIIEKIFVCGGFAQVKGFVELLDNQLPATTVLWNPFDRMRCDADRLCKDILQEKGPAMAVAAGLAMRAI